MIKLILTVFLFEQLSFVYFFEKIYNVFFFYSLYFLTYFILKEKQKIEKEKQIMGSIK